LQNSRSTPPHQLFVVHAMPEITEHPFAEYVRILGKGKTTSRSLTFDEAQKAFTCILNGEVEKIQLGAFLLLLRVKGENADEMAGFALATQAFIDAPEIEADIDWPSYAGKHKQQHWYLLAAQLLADAGYKIFMHGSAYHTAGRCYSEEVLPEIGIPCATNWNDAQISLQESNFAFMPLKYFCSPVEQLFNYRNMLGVRSPAHSFIKLVNPSRSVISLQSIFHPAYAEVHQQAAEKLGYRENLVIKGEGGEVEFRPDADNRLLLIRNGQMMQEKWPRQLNKRQPVVGVENISAEKLRELWTSSDQSQLEEGLRYGYEALIGTVAMVLLAHNEVSNEKDARELAMEYWCKRNKDRL